MNGSVLGLDKLYHLHLSHKLAVVRILEVHVQVEGTADSSVSDHRGEYLRAVDLDRWLSYCCDFHKLVQAHCSLS